MITKQDTILFQGDSITDCGRDQNASGPNDPAALGHGYAFFAAGRLLAQRPDDRLRIFNRGISGHRVPDLAERWDRDCIKLKPSLLSILIGVNDVWHQFNGTYRCTPTEFEDGYHTLIDRTRRELPEVKLVICEPFVLRCGVVDDKWFPIMDEFRAAACRQADVFGVPLVPFQKMFDEAVKKAPPEYWAADGVHPTIAGHWLMAKTWHEVVNK